jgi:hypothetical protein
MAMTHSARKKELERFWLDRAMSVRPDLLSGVVAAVEPPDFILTAGDVRTAVEITRFVTDPLARPNPEQQAGLQMRTLQDARHLFTAASSIPWHVQVIFSRVPFESKAAVQACSGALASFLASRAASLPVWGRLEWDRDDIDLPPQVAGVHASLVPEQRFAHWTPANAGWVRSATESELTSIITKKARGYPVYRQTATEVVLLIVFEGRPKLGRSIYPPDEPVRFAVDTVFDRVLCLDVLSGRLVAIPRRGFALPDPDRT